MNKLYKTILKIVIVSFITLAIFTMGFTLAGIHEAKGADIKTFKIQRLKPNMWFEGTNSIGDIKGYGYYLTKSDGTVVLLVINPQGGIIEIQL